jgi:arylsulfatase A-like enzyme
MNKQQRNAIALAGLLCWTAGTNTEVRAQGSSAKPNIIFILTDDLGSGDIGAFFQNSRQSGQPRLYTPALDRMAAEGAMLMQHYCAAPVCAPSRASILLGKSQGHANVRDNQFDKALEDNHTVASMLRYAGYKTAAIGKWGLQGKGKGPDWPAHPLKRGFDYYYGYIRHRDGHEHYPKEGPYKGPKEVWENDQEVSDGLDKCYTGDLFTAKAKKYIIDYQRGDDADKPFFMYLAYDTPHAILQLPTQAYPKGGGLNGGLQWLGQPGKMINTASGTIDSYVYPQYARATYDHDNDPATPEIAWPDTYKRFASVNKRIDEQVGDLLQLLKDLKIDRNTLVVFTSDNGPSQESYLPQETYVRYEADFFNSFALFDGIKRDLYEGGLRTSTIAWWPGGIDAGTVVETPNASYDWLPTFADIACIPEWMECHFVRH